jgi:hypothetical protein
MQGGGEFPNKETGIDDAEKLSQSMTRGLPICR